MCVRLAKKNDEGALTEIANRNLGEAFSEEDFKSSFNNPQMIVLLYEKSKEPFGYLAATFAADEAELIQIAVDKEIRGCGIGTRLLKDLIERLKQLKVATIFLEVRLSNLAAIAFYEGFNFKKVGTRPGFYVNPKEDAIIMRLEL